MITPSDRNAQPPHHRTLHLLSDPRVLLALEFLRLLSNLCALLSLKEWDVSKEVN
jgi:hypothetical protein